MHLIRVELPVSLRGKIDMDPTRDTVKCQHLYRRAPVLLTQASRYIDAVVTNAVETIVIIPSGCLALLCVSSTLPLRPIPQQ